MNQIEERSIALAGILQANRGVQSLAREGFVDDGILQTGLKSILVLDAMNTPSVYGGIESLESGLNILANGMLQSAAAQDVELLRYTMQIMQLQLTLSRDREKMTSFAVDVERLSSHEGQDLIDACSDVYQKHLSVIQPQILVQGEENHLGRHDIPPKVRALLLASLRSAVLWQQKGGTRFKMVWERTRMQNAAKTLLSR